MRISMVEKSTIPPCMARVIGLLWFAAALASAVSAQTRIRLATIVPSGTSYHHSLQEMGAKWKQASGGAVSLTIYADGTMGSEPETVRRMRIGQLQAAVLTVGGLSEIDPSVGALQKMPLMYRSLDEARYVRAKLAPELERRLAEKGFVVLFWTDAGWVRLFSKEQAFLPQEYRKMKIMVTAGDNDQPEVMKAIELNPVSLEWSDTLTGLQTGMVDALATVPLHALTSQFFQVTHHMLKVNWVPLVGALIVTKQAWDALPATERDAMLQAAAQCGQEFQNQGLLENQEALESMKKRGLQVHPLDPETEDKWRQFAEGIYPKVRGRIVPADMFDQVVEILRDYRARQGASGK
ncbi:MAG TPA: TRAP transporter substrate-binding protein DctP [Candidatus Acidoferrales bacterium]|nr:TRAP transporter substrate-binding protein DctP [Candidatus Acidoferrales bacterium]